MLIDKLAAATGAAVVALFLASPASALTMAECSVKYNAAKDAGTLNGQTWNQFRKAECGSDASAAADSGTTKAKSSTADTSTGKAAKKSAAAVNDSSGANGLTMAECSAKYQAAKSANTLNGMKWNDFRKSECGAGAGAGAAAATSKKGSAGTADDGVSNKGLSMAECSAKYQAAKSANTLNGMKWNDFRKSECGPSGSIAAAAPTKSATATSDSSGGKGLSMAECSAKYQAAKSGGTLNGMKWNDFRKAQCGANASDDDTVPAASEASYTGDPETPTIKAPSGVKFPSTVAKKYASETPGKARMHTCLDQYYANKDANSLNGLRWIQKGGGYYSLCNAKLKG